MSLSSVNSVVESGWRERGGERSEPERDRQPDLGWCARFCENLREIYNFRQSLVSRR
jgi:hypothetical protein